MTATMQPRLELVLDDEHPWFEHIMAAQRAQRNPKGIAGVVKPPAPLEVTLHLDGKAQRYNLEHVAALEWSDAKAKMRTNWVPHGGPTDLDEETTTTTKGDTKK